MNGSWILRLAGVALLAVTAAITQTRDLSRARWYKGNLHTHTLNSDGDSTPNEVAAWYRSHGYQFLVLSDHNFLTETAGLNAVHGAKEKFLLIAGVEVTDQFGKSSIHLNAYNPSRLVLPRHGNSVADTIQNNINAIGEAGGLASLNHPNFLWSVTAEDMLKVKGLRMFEVYNGHPTVNNRGGGGVRSTEEIWDVLLTAGQRVYGIAVDDAHVFKIIGQDQTNPGRGWVNVKAESLSAQAIVDALSQGEFYASTGVLLADVKTGGGEYRIEIDPRPQEKFTTIFIGEGGKVLARSFDANPVYKPSGAEKYVRARVDSSFGASAWTQPVFLAR